MPPSRSEQRARYVVSGLSRFVTDNGLSPVPALVAPVIEAYCSLGLSDRHSATKGTYRSVLRQLSGTPRPKVAPSFPGSRAQPPYSGEERAELYAIARGQRTAWRRHSALCLICLSMGAGLRASEIVKVRRSDLVASQHGMSVHLDGERPRLVPVTGEAALVLGRLCRGAGDDHLFHPEEADRSYQNFVNNFCRNLVADPLAPKLTVARLRSSFVCDHLSAGTSLGELLAMTGISQVESLRYYTCHIESAPHSKAALRAALAKE